MRLVAVVQARLGSTRLPRKVLEPIRGFPMLWHVCDRLSRADVEKLVVATPPQDAGEIAEAVHPFQVIAPAVPEDDLIARHAAVCEALAADGVVRVPSDNPCVDPREVTRLITHFNAAPDAARRGKLFSNIGPLQRNGYADGFGCEIYSRELLEWANANLTKPFDREHPHRHFVRRGLLRLVSAPKWSQAPHLRFDVNDQDDLDFVRDVFDGVWSRHHVFTMREAIQFVEGRKV